MKALRRFFDMREFAKEKWPKQGPGQVEGNSKCQPFVRATMLTSAQEEFFQIRQEHLAIGACHLKGQKETPQARGRRNGGGGSK